MAVRGTDAGTASGSAPVGAQRGQRPAELTAPAPGFGTPSPCPDTDVAQPRCSPRPVRLLAP